MNPTVDITQRVQQGIQMAEQIYTTVIEYLVKYGFQVLGGLIILFIGFKIAGWAARLITGICQKKHMDVTLTKFIAGAVRIVILVFVGIMAVEKFGVTISPLIASIGALIFGASFALQAPLSNFAAGLVVIFTRPFVVGNTISVQGVSGIVEEVKLPSTILVTEDGERITIPNKEIVGQILVNSAANRIVEGKVGISYDADPEKAIRVIGEVLGRSSAVVKQPAPQIGIEAFGDSSVDIAYRYWVPTNVYFQTLYTINLEVYRAVRAAGITIPFPQRDVHIVSKV